MNEYLNAWRKFLVFTGRSTRREFWMFCLVHFIVTGALVILGKQASGLQLISTLYGLAVFFPILSVSIRRLHDTDRTGWWLLMMLLPLIGTIVLVIFYIQESTPGSNRYGQNPKGIPAPAMHDAGLRPTAI